MKKPPASVGRICDAGNVAIFTNKGGYIIDKQDIGDLMKGIEKRQGRTLKMKRDKGVYNFRLKVLVEKSKGEQERSRMKGNRYAALAEGDEGIFRGRGAASTKAHARKTEQAS